MTKSELAIILGVDKKALVNLTMLDASGSSGITDDGLRHVPKLTTLNAASNPRITDAGLRHLPKLTTLDASGNSGITDAGRKLIAERTK